MQIEKTEFDITSLDDEIRVDERCKELLSGYYQSLLDAGLSPAEATQLANGADYFVRDFVVAVKQRNLFDEQAGIVRQFAGNWYIVNTLEPSLEVLAGYLGGVADFYRHLHRLGLISAEFAQQVAGECADISFYGERLDAFWEISGDGYHAWERACSLRDEKREA